MNGRAARLLRRDVRRTVGEEAIGIIAAQTNAINHQILPNLNSSQARLAQIDERLHALEAHAHHPADALRDLRQDCAAVWSRLDDRLMVVEGHRLVLDDQVRDLAVRMFARTFLQRVRWLVYGR